MRLAAHLCTAAAAIVSLLVLQAKLAEGRMEQWQVQSGVSPLVSGVNPITAPNQPLPLQLNTRIRARRNIYPGHQPQEEPDTKGNYWTRRPGGRYHNSRASSERRLYTQRQWDATERYESREPQPRRVHATHFTAGHGESRDSLPTERWSTRVNERFPSHVHQDPQAATSHDAGVHSFSRGNTPQISERDQHADSNHETLHPGPRSRADLPTVPGGTGNPPDGQNVPGDHHRVQTDVTDEDEYELQPLEVPDPALCCGSNMPLDHRNAQATGAFQRVAAAGSVKVVDLPAQHSFPPADVRDLRAEPRDLRTLSLTWTAPGEDLDHGTASGYIIRLSEKQGDLRDSHFNAAPEETLLETSESLAAAGVYQPAGTRVMAEIPLRQWLQPGRAYYVALKAFDKGGHFSGVSNVARVYVPGSMTEENAAVQHHGTAEHSIQDPRPKEPQGTSNSPESTRRRGETTTLHENKSFSRLARGPDAARIPTGYSDGNSEDQSLPATPPPLDPGPMQPDGAGKQKRRKGRINSRRKKNRSERRRNNRRRKQRRRGGAQRGKHNKTSTEEPEACEYSEQEQLESASLCEARYSLALAIAYFSQNNEHQYLDHLAAALSRLEQKMQPPWRTSQGFEE